VQLGPKDEERLRIFQAAELARRTLERGLRLNAPEAVALVCDEMHLAARGGASFEQVAEVFGAAAADGPGAVVTAAGDIELTPDRERLRLVVRNTSRRPVRVSSHYPFWRANPALEFDREAARGFRLDLPAGDQLRWGPGESHQVDLVRYAGEEVP
jgi:urease subunit gamma/beta